MTRTSAPSRRLTSIDWLRGLVMILMTLDHVRAYFSNGPHDPMSDPSVESSLFFTRFITHLCAPVFIFLSGISIGLMLKKKNKQELSLFLITRGIWLIFLELTLISFAWKFDFSTEPYAFMLQVIWAMGVAMVIMSALIHIPYRILLLTVIALLLLSDLFTAWLPKSSFPDVDPFWLSIHKLMKFEIFNIKFFVVYPILNWTLVMALGFLIAPVYQWSSFSRKTFYFRLGSLMIVSFFVLRFINSYGDPNGWMVHPLLQNTIHDFFNLGKYPPTLLFLMLTLGINFLIMAALEKVQPKYNNPLVVIGKVPQFYYILHLYLIHSLMIIIGLSMNFDLTELTVSSNHKPKNFGFGLLVVYLMTLLVIVLLYPLCVKFSKYKSRHKKWWLSYL